MRQLRLIHILASAAMTLLIGCGRAPVGTAQAARDLPQPVAMPAFPLHVEPGKRYLVDSAGRPFLIKGDAPWCLLTQLSLDQAEAYLDDRRVKGFNTILVRLTESTLCSSHVPRNSRGDEPFGAPGDFTKPNEAYFAFADAVIGMAERKGFLVLMAPAYMGYLGGEQGWYEQMKVLGPAALREFGRYVARRFAAHHNIVWVQGGDFSPPELQLLRAVAEGIRDVDAAQLQTFHGGRLSSALGFLGTSERWVALNTVYTNDRSVVGQSLEEYRRSSMPFFLIEAIYEQEHGATEATVRLQAYQALLSGAAGHVMGHRSIWQFLDGWRNDLQSSGARSIAHLHALLDALPWWTLEPDVDLRWLTSGAGSGARAVAALTSDRRIAIVYTPDIRYFTFDLKALNGSHVRARWFDPTDGTYESAIGSPFVARGNHGFSPPGPNAHGYGDWVLVLETD
jgi:hypothetical protein